MNKKVSRERLSCFPHAVRKRGISAVVATVLIILVTVAGVAIIWTSIVPMIKEGLEFSGLDGMVSIVSSGGYTTYDLEKKLAMVQIKREVDDGGMNKTRVIFSINGSSYGSIVVAPESGMTRVYIFNLSEYGKPDSVSVVPVFIVGSSEKEGAVTSDIIMPIGIISTVSGIIYELESDNISVVTECNDGIDNDGDGFIDLSDSGCSNSSDDDEFTPIIVECNDGIDNDGDSFIDYPNDPDCTASSDNNESTLVLTECSDGLDNDGDSFIDYPNDPGCIDSSDDNETNPVVTECNDGIDNDGNTFIDYPNDPGCTASSDDNESGPVGWWKFEGNYDDSSGFNNDGVQSTAAYEPSLTTGIVGQAYNFDGVDDYIEIPQAFYSPNEVTFLFWVFQEEYDRGKEHIGGDYRSDPSQRGLDFLFVNSDRIRVEFRVSGEYVDTPVGSVTFGEWFHVAVTASQSTGRASIYVNGSLVREYFPTFPVSTQLDPYIFGRRGTDGPYWKGKMDEVMVFDRALSQGEIISIYEF